MIISRPIYRVTKPVALEQSFKLRRLPIAAFYLPMNGNRRKPFSEILGNKEPLLGWVPPGDLIGMPGEYYLDQAAHLLYGPKQETWPEGIPEKQVLLVQGATPEDPKVFHGGVLVQGGYRCALNVVTPPTLGHVVVADNQLGFMYTPCSPHWVGKDSFSYSLSNIFGYESDAKCIYVVVGL